MRTWSPGDDQRAQAAAEQGLSEAALLALSQLPYATVVGPEERDAEREALGPEVSHLLPPRDDVRYDRLMPIGKGGMGEVWRVFDRRLRCDVAMKILPLVGNEAALLRFQSEAHTVATLRYPGIVQVYDLGQLPDGQWFFTMEEVTGGTLRDQLLARPVQGWSLTELAVHVRLLRGVADAVAYAHLRGVLHRDLKPANIMIGKAFEAQVVDWGIAKSLARVDRGVIDAHRREVAGTPAYMAPEQAEGHPTFRSDLYSLGAVLHEVLWGEPPYGFGPAFDVLDALRVGPPPQRAMTGLPEDLVALTRQALARDPDQRPADARSLSHALDAWLDRMNRVERALAIVEEADQLGAEMARLRAEAEGIAAQATQTLGAIPPYAPVETKVPGWNLEAEAAARRVDVAVIEARYQQALEGALKLVPDLPEATDRLADLHRARHAQAVRERRPMDAAREEQLLRRVDRSGRHRAWLEGSASLSLITDPPGARVDIYRFQVRSGRLEPVWWGSAGNTPLHAVSVPHGSLLAVIRSPGTADVRYPIHVERLEHWDGVPPGESEAAVIRLLDRSAIREDEVYIPAGWFRSGGDVLASDKLSSRRIWVDGFIARRHPVAVAEYFAFLNDLVDQDRKEDALRLAPVDDKGMLDGPSTLCFAWSGSRLIPTQDYTLQPWEDRWPITQVSWHGASAFAAWLAERQRHPWRLPHDQEWEKAARGVDGRHFPWGDRFEPTWARMADSMETAPRRCPIDDYPEDEGVYGLRGAAGNVREWCANPYVRMGVPEGARVGQEETGGSPFRMVRGGHWFTSDQGCRLAGRFVEVPERRLQVIGFRVVRDLEGS